MSERIYIYSGAERHHPPRVMTKYKEVGKLFLFQEYSARGLAGPGQSRGWRRSQHLAPCLTQGLELLQRRGKEVPSFSFLFFPLKTTAGSCFETKVRTWTLLSCPVLLQVSFFSTFTLVFKLLFRSLFKSLNPIVCYFSSVLFLSFSVPPP